MTNLLEQKRTLIARWKQEGFDPKLLKAFEVVPREEFIPAELREQAYVDQPLQIGFEQTNSQPTTILIMLSLLEVASPIMRAAPRAGQAGPTKQKVLEIGAGSGYVCALLAALGCSVTGIEIVPELAVRAGRILAKLGLASSVTVHAADGGAGWEEDAPYDRILISAGAPAVPRHLLAQLQDGGCLIAPVGRVEQRMIVCRKKRGGEVTEEDHGAFLFVPLTGKFGAEGAGDMPNLPFI